jgi:hypothetical protein
MEELIKAFKRIQALSKPSNSNSKSNFYFSIRLSYPRDSEEIEFEEMTKVFFVTSSPIIQ